MSPRPQDQPDDPDDVELLGVLHAAVDAIVVALGQLEDWGLAGTRRAQYRCDLAADAAALAVLDAAGLSVLSEESGRHGTGRPVTVVIDPVDGSTNASKGLAFYAASLCALDAEGPRVAVVAHLAGGPRYEAIRGGGARRDGMAISPSGCDSLNRAVVGLNGWSARHLGWAQYRALGSAALELCAVADGTLDGYCDVSPDGLAPWDYLGAALVCSEAGACVVGAERVAGAERTATEGVGAGSAAPGLWVGEQRRSVVAAAGPALLDELLAARSSLTDGPAPVSDKST